GRPPAAMGVRVGLARPGEPLRVRPPLAISGRYPPPEGRGWRPSQTAVSPLERYPQVVGRENPVLADETVLPSRPPVLRGRNFLGERASGTCSPPGNDTMAVRRRPGRQHCKPKVRVKATDSRRSFHSR